MGDSEQALEPGGYFELPSEAWAPRTVRLVPPRVSHVTELPHNLTGAMDKFSSALRLSSTTPHHKKPVLFARIDAGETLRWRTERPNLSEYSLP